MSDAPNVFNSSNRERVPRMPVYFWSVGGPSFLDNKNHPAYLTLAAHGRDITTKIKPKAVVVLSAHWQDGGANKVLVNTAENVDIIYDFGDMTNFPQHFFDHKYPSKGSPSIAAKVIANLRAAGIEAEGTVRGLDHGVWCGFIPAFDPETNPLNVPVVQVSLYDSEDPDQHYRLGQALESLRDEGILIIATGMAVHNLKDYWPSRNSGTTMPYAYSFERLITEAVIAEPQHRQGKLAALLEHPDARVAHPSVEHLLPVHIAAGAAGRDLGERMWTFPEGSMNWAQYRFGEIEEA